MKSWQKIMIVNRAVGSLIRDCKTVQIQSVLQTGRSQGMLLLDDSIAELVREKKITREMALRFCEDPKRLPG